MGAYVQGNTYASGSTGITTTNLGLTGVVTNHLLVLAMSMSAGSQIINVTDNQGNAWVDIAGQAASASNWYYASNIGTGMQIYYCLAKSSGTLTVTFTLSVSTQFVRLLLHEYSGYLGTLDVANTGICLLYTSPSQR